MSVTSSAECPTVTRIPAEVHRYTSITVIPMHQNCHCPTNPSVNWETDSVKFKEIYIYMSNQWYFYVLILHLFFHYVSFSTQDSSQLTYKATCVCTFETLCLIFIMKCWYLDWFVSDLPNVNWSFYHYYLVFFQFHLCLECCPQTCAKSTKKGPV